MRILLLHAEDSPPAGPWVGQQWDAVFDLARSGWAACERWSTNFRCPVKPIDSLREGDSQIGRVRELLEWGLGRLLDREGLDWWELTAILVHTRLETLVLLRRMAEDLPPDSEVWITRESFEAVALRLSVGDRLHVFSSRVGASRRGLGHYASRLRSLPVSQVRQILGDKYDAGYRVRRYFHSRPRATKKAAVLVPSSYINMSLTGAAYARVLPGTHFLLVSTRASGRLNQAPDNVRQAWLAAYAGDSGADELADILKRWAMLKADIAPIPELAALIKLGLTDDFPDWFAKGLAIRNAWLEVLKSQPIKAVLCTDDSNPHTHIPLLLARQRGLPTIACHHGALDGRHLIKKNHAHVILAKGRMEEDYLVQHCGVDASEVEIGAPSAPERASNGSPGERDWIVFFSEPYEVTAGRAEEIYRDIMPGLANLAEQSEKTVVVKLHPSENVPDRKSLVAKILDREQFEKIEWFTGQLGPELLRRTWFGLTVQSSVAMECVVYGVPCFVCEWMDLWPYGYIGQYRKFGVGIGLSEPAEIAKIPEVLSSYKPNPAIVQDCWEAITADRFEEILAGQRVPFAITAGMQRAQ
jgi:hypothetical protein